MLVVGQILIFVPYFPLFFVVNAKINDEEVSRGVQSQPFMPHLLAQGISPLAGGANHMPAGAQGCIFGINSLHTGAGNNTQFVTAPANGGNVAQAMLNSPPVINQGTVVHTSSCTYKDCGMGLMEACKRLYCVIGCHTRMNDNST